MDIVVIEFVIPNSSRIIRVIRVDDSLKPKFDEVQKAGLRFTLENFGNGAARVIFEHPNMGGVLVKLTPYDFWELELAKMLAEYDSKMLEDMKSDKPAWGGTAWESEFDEDT